LDPGVDGGTPTTDTEAVAVEPPFCAVAVTVQVVVELAAVSNPEVEIEQVPDTDQLTAKLAVNCCFALGCSDTEAGETVTACTVTLAESVAPEASVAVAVTVPVVTELGAVNCPVVELIDPIEAA
jgi:hypothetical protein